MKTIKDLFFANNIPFELPALDEEEWQCLTQRFSEKETPFFQSMTKEQKKLYEDYQDARLDIAVSEPRDAFVRGFRMGARLMREVMGDEKQ